MRETYAYFTTYCRIHKKRGFENWIEFIRKFFSQKADLICIPMMRIKDVEFSINNRYIK